VRRSLSLVLPVFNGARVLAARLAEVQAWLDAQPTSTELIVVDDGSTDATPRILRDCARARVLRLDRNRGKGRAVRAGLAAATGDYRLFLDADLALPAENADAVVAALEAGADVAIGSRAHARSRVEAGPAAAWDLALRHSCGRVFNLLARACAVPGLRDTQAGIKGLTAAATRLLLPRCAVDRFAFDVELLFHARRLGLAVAEVPVRMVWRRGESGLRLGRDGVKMAADVVLFRLRAVSLGVRRRHDAAVAEERGVP
jgi:dolichyl-phosphate beta-glucosyltransferase